MRATAFALLIPLALAACDGKPITGPDAQRLVAKAKPQSGKLPAGTIVLVDGVRLASDQSLEELDPSTVQTVEVLKGALARQRYGADAGGGVILITTKRPALTRPQP